MRRIVAIMDTVLCKIRLTTQHSAFCSWLVGQDAARHMWIVQDNRFLIKIYIHGNCKSHDEAACTCSVSPDTPSSTSRLPF
jgi:hypothetical protein